MTSVLAVMRLQSAKRRYDPPSDPEEESGVTVAYKVFVEDCQTIDDLKSFWKQNQEELKKLEKSHPDLYKEIFQLFSAKKKELS